MLNEISQLTKPHQFVIIKATKRRRGQVLSINYCREFVDGENEYNCDTKSPSEWNQSFPCCHVIDYEMNARSKFRWYREISSPFIQGAIFLFLRR